MLDAITFIAAGFSFGVAITLLAIALCGSFIDDDEIPEDAMGDYPNTESFGGVHNARKDYP